MDIHKIVKKIFMFILRVWILLNFECATCNWFWTGTRMGWTKGSPGAVMTGGLVQEFHHVVLPTVPPIVTLLATVLSILVRNWQFICIKWGLGIDPSYCSRLWLLIQGLSLWQRWRSHGIYEYWMQMNVEAVHQLKEHFSSRVCKMINESSLNISRLIR